MPNGKTKVPKYPRGKCDEFDIKIMAIAEDNPAATDCGIARELGCDQETIARRRARKEYLDLYVARNLPARDIIRNARTKAAKRLAEALDADATIVVDKTPSEVTDHKTRVLAAKAILGPELLGPEGDGGSGGGKVPLSGEAAAGLLEYFSQVHRRAVQEDRA